MFEELLNKTGTTFVSEIKSNMQSARKNATGKTGRSLKATVTDNDDFTKLKIDAASYFFVLETGRKPGKRPPIDSIMEWVKAKGVNINPYAIATNIGKFGTKLFRMGGRTDIFSNVINDESVAKIEKEIADISLKVTADNIVKSYEKRN